MRRVRRASTKGSQFAILPCEGRGPTASELEIGRLGEFES